ncbi:MAG: electron transfer flavoprotein subunit beta/FixA family protein [Legionellaceae bacterium]|nr:electron transfer flavoprotein subunit beta/FixA family protein [Legionellaceae bacterium]
MKILVAIKRVIDPYVKIRIKPDQTAVETQNVKMSMNPFDEIAVEEAIRWKEQGLCEEVVLLSIGPAMVQETLRHGLALGACRAIFVETEQRLDSLDVAKIIKKITERENPDCVMLGKQAIDGDNNQTAQMLAALLDWPQATNVSEMRLEGDKMQAVREIDGGLETLLLTMPCVISTDLRLNEPRYASLPNIMKAKRKPLDCLCLDDLSLSIKEHTRVLSVKAPEPRSGGEILSSVEELVRKLANDDKVI